MPINVSSASAFDSPVGVTVRRQRHWTCGIWIEGVDELDEVSNAEAQKIKQAIVATAAESSGAKTGRASTAEATEEKYPWLRFTCRRSGRLEESVLFSRRMSRLTRKRAVD
jgi:hypothetical protein